MRPDQLGVQAHCLRFEIAKDLDAALSAVSALGIGAIEMMSFAGCRGNPWGDFGAAADLSAHAIRNSIRAAGLHCPSIMVHEHELAPGHLEQTLDWIGELGVGRIVLTALAMSRERRLEHWHQAFERLLLLAAKIRAAGLRLIIHTQPELWAPIDGTLPADELLDRSDPDLLQVEFDPSGAIIYGAGPAAFIRRRPAVFYGLHLRDATPPAAGPVTYLPAEPLGAGGIEWGSLMQAAQESAMQWYFLEMEVRQAEQTLAAIAASRQYLLAGGLLDHPA
jgi:sugar phosphate isomerase/epimerase